MQLTISDEDDQRTNAMMDMLRWRRNVLKDRRNWLQEKSDLADLGDVTVVAHFIRSLAPRMDKQSRHDAAA